MDEDQTNNQNEFLINYISENKEDKKLSNDQSKFSYNIFTCFFYLFPYYIRTSEFSKCL